MVEKDISVTLRADSYLSWWWNFQIIRSTFPSPSRLLFIGQIQLSQSKRSPKFRADDKVLHAVDPSYWHHMMNQSIRWKLAKLWANFNIIRGATTQLGYAEPWQPITLIRCLARCCCSCANEHILGNISCALRIYLFDPVGLQYVFGTYRFIRNFSHGPLRSTVRIVLVEELNKFPSPPPRRRIPVYYRISTGKPSPALCCVVQYSQTA